MKLAVVGSRKFENYPLLEETINELGIHISAIVSGGAQGADKLAEIWAHNNNKPLIVFKPEWGLYGKSAGVIRNKKIIEECDYCLVFWDGASKGTKSSIDLCKKLTKPHKIVLFTIQST